MCLSDSSRKRGQLPESCFPLQQPRRRDGRVAEGAGLESVFTRKGNVGSLGPMLPVIYAGRAPGRNSKACALSESTGQGTN